MSDAATKKNAHLWARDEFDWYIEPSLATEQLLAVEKFDGETFHDPCCGGGNIVGALLSAGYDATGSDVVQRVNPAPDWFLGVFDFLSDADFGQPDNIVMNPPFFRAKGAEAFIRKALSITRRKIAAFVDVRFIAGAQRANGLFAEHPPHRIWIVTPRVSCPPGAYLAAGNKAEGGSADWCWLVWANDSPFTGTSLGWLRRAA